MAYVHAQQVYSAFGFLFMALFLGVPLWWKTTEVYRASLPYSEIDSLTETDIQVKIPILIATTGDISMQLKGVTQSILENLKNCPRCQVFYPAYDFEILTIEQCSEIPRQNVKKLTFAFLPADLMSKCQTEMPCGDVVLVETDTASNDVVEFFTESIQKNLPVSTEKLDYIFMASSGARFAFMSPGRLRSVKAHSGYDVTFTLLNSDPSKFKISWNPEELVDAYFSSYFQQLKSFVNIHMQSQIALYPKVRVKPLYDPSNESYFYRENDLHHLITPIESKLGSYVSKNPELNFVIFVPSGSHYPLFIDSSGSRQSAFISPRWGGVYIYNPPENQNNNTASFAPIHIDSTELAQVFIPQLRSLLGFENVECSLKSSRLGNLEVNAWMLKRTAEQIATVSDTLSSLSKLVSHIPNMVINDHIAAEVSHAVFLTKDSLRHLAEGDIIKSFQASKQALVFSEKAFFDPSLLELLYFPEDQKFAIYVPLFVPIGIPILMSLFHAVQWVRGKRAKTKSD